MQNKTNISNAVKSAKYAYTVNVIKYENYMNTCDIVLPYRGKGFP